MLKNNGNPLLTSQESANLNEVPSIPNDRDFGVDFLNTRIDLDPQSINVSSPIWSINRKGKAPEPNVSYGAYYAKMPFQQTVVDVMVNTYDFRAYIRFNPSTALFGKTRRLAPPAACGPLIEQLLFEVSGYFIPIFDSVDAQGTFTRAPNWQDQVWVSRIDPARNLIIDDPHNFKKGIEAATPVNKKNEIHL